MTPRAVACLLVVAGAWIAPGCATAPQPGDEEPVEIVVVGADETGESTVRGFAARELRAFATHGRRDADLADAAYAMQKGLTRAGHAHASVSFRTEPTDAGSKRVVFDVNEGPLARLGSARLTGVEAIEEADLEPHLQFSESGLFEVGDPLYRATAVLDAVDAIEQAYLVRGYFRAQVGPPTTTWDADRTRADVTIPVREGSRYTVSGVTIEGDVDPEMRTALEGMLELQGTPYHSGVAPAAAGRVRRWLLNRGRQRAEVGVDTEVDDEAATAHIRLHVVPGPEVRLRRLRVEGLERTNEAFVERRFRLAPGDTLEQGALDEAVDELYRSGAFRSIRPQVSVADGPDAAQDEADVIVTIDELDARSIDVELGWGSYEQLRGRVRYLDRNLFGLARTFDVTLEGSLKSTRIGSRVVDRTLLGRGFTLSSGVSYEQREEPSFTRESFRFDVTTRKSLTTWLDVDAGYELRAQDARSVNGRIPTAEESGFVRSAGPAARLTLDTRDDPLFPTSGLHAQAGVFWSDEAVGADLNFLETVLALGTYQRLGPRTVLALGARLETRETLDDENTLPIQERLFLGGANTVRSFGQAELGPFDAGRDPVGGLTAAFASAELRQRLAGNLDGAVFYDVGTVSPKDWSLSSPSGAAVGVGLRYRLPVGPARLDFAYNPGRRFAAGAGWALHFSFGFSF